MSGIVETPFKLTQEELLCSAAITIFLNKFIEDGCETRSIAQMCFTPQYGFTAKASFLPCGPRYVRITDVKGGDVDWDNVPFCECDNPSGYELSPGDILVARAGSIGKTFIVKDVPGQAVFASYMIRLTVLPDFSPEYVYWCFQSQQFWQQITEAQRGSAMKNINGQMLRSLVFPTPNRQMQDAAVKFLHGFRMYLKGQRLSLPEIPPGLSKQCRRIARIERFAAKIEEAHKLQKEADTLVEVAYPCFVSDFSFEKKDWTTVQAAILDKKGSVRSGPFGSQLLHEEFVEAGIAAIGTRDVQVNKFDFKSGWYVEYEKFEEFRRYQVYPGDILGTIVGASIGRFCIVPADIPLAFTTKHIMALTLDQSKALPNFVSYMLNFHSKCRNSLFAQSEGSAQPSLNSSKILSTKIPLPSLKEQYRIVAHLDTLQAQIDTLKRKQAEVAAELDALLPSILDKAFKGEL